MRWKVRSNGLSWVINAEHATFGKDNVLILYNGGYNPDAAAPAENVVAYFNTWDACYLDQGSEYE